MNLYELKALLHYETSGERPGAKELITSGSKLIVCTDANAEPEILVYENGFFIYRRHGHATVGSVVDCGSYKYEFEEQYITLSDEFFDGLDWKIRLTIEGEERILKNQARVLRNTVPLHTCMPERVLVKTEGTPLDSIISKENGRSLKQLYLTLNDGQKKLLRRMYLKGESCIDISRENGVSYQAIQNRHHKILKKLRKIIKGGCK